MTLEESASTTEEELKTYYDLRTINICVLFMYTCRVCCIYAISMTLCHYIIHVGRLYLVSTLSIHLGGGNVMAQPFVS